jgi:hypothetical protein
MGNIIGKRTCNTTIWLEVDSSPAQTPGYTAPIGSFAIWADQMYKKMSALDTGWVRLSTNRVDFIPMTTGVFQLSTSNERVEFSGSTIGQIVNLGDATNYNLGHNFIICNKGGVGLDVVSNSGSPVARVKPLECVDFILTNNTTTDGIWDTTTSVDTTNLSNCSEIHDDWISGSVASSLNWTSTVSGTSALVSLNTANLTINNPGTVQLATGTTTTGRASLSLGTNTVSIGGGHTHFNIKANVPVLSVSGQDYIVRVGFGDNTGAGDFVDGVYFEYNRAISHNVILKTSSNSVRTQTITQMPVTIGWFNLMVEMNDIGTQAVFFLNGAFIGSIVTNIPVGVARSFAPILKIEKTSGTTSRLFLVDYFKAMQVFTNKR